MKKVNLQPRENWQQKCDERGFFYHSVDDKYWIEDYAVEFDYRELKELENSANELHQMCLDFVGDVIKKGDYQHYNLMPNVLSHIEHSWRKKDFDLYSRFDFSYDGQSPPKLLEYNADTPTTLIETAIVQKDWHLHYPNTYQFNSIEEELVKQWKKYMSQVQSDDYVYFTCENSQEDWCNAEYIREAAQSAGIKTKFIELRSIGLNNETFEFVDIDNQKINHLFKLYPWEFLVEDSFYPYIPNNHLNIIEPIWKMLLSTKAILPQLWQKYPNHPNLLPAFFNEDDIKNITNNYVKKPFLSREGANVAIYENEEIIDSQKGPYGQGGYVYQQRKDLVCFDNRFSMMGVWMIGDKATGLGIREDHTLITKDSSWFVPHYCKE